MAVVDVGPIPVDPADENAPMEMALVPRDEGMVVPVRLVITPIEPAAAPIAIDPVAPASAFHPIATLLGPVTPALNPITTLPVAPALKEVLYPMDTPAALLEMALVPPMYPAMVPAVGTD